MKRHLQAAILKDYLGLSTRLKTSSLDFPFSWLVFLIGFNNNTISFLFSFLSCDFHQNNGKNQRIDIFSTGYPPCYIIIAVSLSWLVLVIGFKCKVWYFGPLCIDLTKILHQATGLYTCPDFMYGGWTELPSKNLATKQNGNPDRFFFVARIRSSFWLVHKQVRTKQFRFWLAEDNHKFRTKRSKTGANSPK